MLCPRMMIAFPLGKEISSRPSACENLAENNKKCNCTYSGCSKHGKCCECLHFHLSMNQLPACCFPAEVERTYDRSFAAFIACRSK